MPNGKRKRASLTISKARENRTKIDWSTFEPTKPTFLGNRYFEDYDIAELARYIDWTPFFQTWQLHGKYPAIFDDAIVGKEAKQLFDDANQLLQEIIDKKLLKAKAVVGFFPANSADDDVLLHDFEEHVRETSLRTARFSPAHRIQNQQSAVANGSNASG